jgi:hypothetical protein
MPVAYRPIASPSCLLALAMSVHGTIAHSPEVPAERAACCRSLRHGDRDPGRRAAHHALRRRLKGAGLSRADGLLAAERRGGQLPGSESIQSPDSRGSELLTPTGCCAAPNPGSSRLDGQDGIADLLSSWPRVGGAANVVCRRRLACHIARHDCLPGRIGHGLSREYPAPPRQIFRRKIVGVIDTVTTDTVVHTRLTDSRMVDQPLSTAYTLLATVGDANWGSRAGCCSPIPAQRASRKRCPLGQVQLAGLGVG